MSEIQRGDVHPIRWATYGDMTDAEIREYLGETDDNDPAVCDVCGLDEHTPEQLAECIDSALGVVPDAQ